MSDFHCTLYQIGSLIGNFPLPSLFYAIDQLVFHPYLGVVSYPMVREYPRPLPDLPLSKQTVNTSTFAKVEDGFLIQDITCLSAPHLQQQNTEFKSDVDTWVEEAMCIALHYSFKTL